MAVRLSMAIQASGDRQLRQMTKTSITCAICAKRPMKEYSGDISGRVHSILHKDLNMHYPCQHLVLKAITPEPEKHE
jgi:predicted HicB family RNase H-like nuclease